MNILKILTASFIFTISFYALSNSAQVYQREYIVTNDKVHDYIATYGLNTCVSLVLYNEYTKKALLSHLDATLDISNVVPSLLEEVPGFTKVYVIGGVKESSIDLFGDVTRVLVNRDIKINYSKENLVRSSSFNIALNLKDGTLEFDPGYEYQDEYEVSLAKGDRLKFTNGRIFRHMESLGGGDYVQIRKRERSNFDFPY